MLDKPILYLKLIGYIVWVIYSELSRALRVKWIHHRAHGQPPVPRDRNIVIVGASFAGNRAAELLTSCLPPNSRYRVVVVEPNSHFQFTWVLPRMCVVKTHEHKAFIPYRGNVFDKPEGVLRWVSDRAERVTATSVHLQDSREEIPYDVLIMATGSDVKQGLPSRVNATDKRRGIELLQGVQNRVESAETVVVVGGGAAGVEVATDAKDLYPNKKVVLVHSRKAVMHRFGTALQNSAQEALNSLGVEVILGERVTEDPAKPGTVLLTSGREIPCDLVLNCTGQKPASGLLATLSPDAISPSGYIKVRPTLQIDDERHPSIYACGDVADTRTPNPNARAAARQAAVVAENVLLVTQGKAPKHVYENSWSDGVIKLTLGLTRSVTHYGSGESELMFPAKETDEALMSARCWSQMGHTPYEDPYMAEHQLKTETV